MLVVTAAAASKNLCTIDDLRKELGITNSDQDAKLLRWIAVASSRIVTYTGRQFIQETVVETLSSKATYRLLLSRTPIVSITSVKLDDVALASTEYFVEDAVAGFMRRSNNIPWTSTQYWQRDIDVFPTGKGALDWEFTYKGGYKLTGADTGAGEVPLPDDIQQACLEMCVNFQVMSGRDSAILTQRVGDASESRVDPSRFSVPPAAKSLLDPYVRID